MFQAVPVFIDDPDHNVGQHEEVHPDNSPQAKTDLTEKVSMERRGFLRSMLQTTTSEESLKTQQVEIAKCESETNQRKEQNRFSLSQAEEKVANVITPVLRVPVQNEPRGALHKQGTTAAATTERNVEKEKKGETWSQGGTGSKKFDDKETSNAKFEARSRYSLSQTPTLRPKLRPFEVPEKESGFSISGMWSNVNLGLVKERSTFWQKCDRKNRRNGNRKSRVIDPNEWVAKPEVTSSASKDETPTNHQLSKNKFMSSGNLVTDTESEVEPPMVLSSAIVAVEKRADGRKSADIFLPSNYNYKMSQVNSRREEKAATKCVDVETKKAVETGSTGASFDLPSAETRTTADGPAAAQMEPIFSSDETCADLPMEEVLKREIERQKLIQQKLKEIEEQNRILAELEANERRLRLEDEERRKRLDEPEVVEPANRSVQTQVMDSAPLEDVSVPAEVIKAEEKLPEVKLEVEVAQPQPHRQLTPEPAPGPKAKEKTPEVVQGFQMTKRQIPPPPPLVPGRSSSRVVVREINLAKMNSPQPQLHLISASVSPAPSSRLSNSPSLEILSPNIVQVKHI